MAGRARAERRTRSPARTFSSSKLPRGAARAAKGYAFALDVKASPAALDFVRERGGKLYVWSRSSRCCGGRLRFLAAATRDDGTHRFRRVPAEEIELYVDLRALPEELELDVRGLLRKNIRAYWDGCAWVS